jgi:chromosome condensin MukBEF ATPase and DNA-binding subunit MukB
MDVRGWAVSERADVLTTQAELRDYIDELEQRIEALVKGREHQRESVRYSNEQAWMMARLLGTMQASMPPSMIGADVRQRFNRN